MNLLEIIKAEYNLYRNNPSDYQDKVNSISDLFFLRGRDRFKWDYCPVYIVGKHDTPFVTFALNPGYDITRSPLEEEVARKSWEHYLDLYVNFYNKFYRFWLPSPYYGALDLLVRGLTNSNNNQSQNIPKPILLDTYLCNIELFPYHSESISLPSRLSGSQLDYLMTNFNNALEFTLQGNRKPELFIFNGKTWYILLINHGIIKESECEKVQLTKSLSLYFFEKEGIQSILFDRFFPAPYWGINNYDRMVRIPGIIKQKIGL